MNFSIRLKDVLLFDKSSGKITFHFDKLLKMKDYKVEDTAHIGKVSKCIFLKSNGITSYRIFGKYSIFFADKNKKTVDIGVYTVDDYTIGRFIIAPICFVILLIMFSIQLKYYIILFILYFIFYRK
jgi:hypothetical protein